MTYIEWTHPWNHHTKSEYSPLILLQPPHKSSLRVTVSSLLTTQVHSDWLWALCLAFCLHILFVSLIQVPAWSLLLSSLLCAVPLWEQIMMSLTGIWVVCHLRLLPMLPHSALKMVRFWWILCFWWACTRMSTVWISTLAYSRITIRRYHWPVFQTVLPRHFQPWRMGIPVVSWAL